MDIDGRICAGILGYPASAICVANRKLVRKVEERGQLNGITSFLLIHCCSRLCCWCGRCFVFVVVFVVFFLEFGRLHLGAKAGNERASPEDTFLKCGERIKKEIHQRGTHRH